MTHFHFLVEKFHYNISMVILFSIFVIIVDCFLHIFLIIE